MSIHGLLQEPASYPSNFITLPFTIPPSSENYGQQAFQAIVRTVTASGGVPTMIANDDFQETEFDLGNNTPEGGINVYLSNITVTLHLDDAVNYNNVAGFGMIAWNYGSTTSRIIIQTYNFGAASITNWRIEVIAFPIIQGGLWPTYKATDQNTSQSLFLGTPISPDPPVQKWVYSNPSFSFNENNIVIGETGILYIAEDGGRLVALRDGGNSAFVLWDFPTGQVNLTSPACGRDAVLYVGSNNALYKLIEIDTINPFNEWSINLTPLTNPFPPLVSYNSTGDATIYISGQNGHVYAVSDEGVSATYKWTFVLPIGAMFIGLSIDGSVLYVSNANVLYSVDTSTGLLKWSRTIGGVPFSTPSVGADGTIYIYGVGTTLYAITDNGTTSTLKWTLAIVGLTSNLFRTISIGGNYDRLYLVTDTQVLAVTDNGASGTTNWIYNVDPSLAPNDLNSVTIGLDGTLYITGDYTLAVCLTDNGASVTKNWDNQLAGGFASQFTIGLNQRCYLGNDQTGIIAL